MSRSAILALLMVTACGSDSANSSNNNDLREDFAQSQKSIEDKLAHIDPCTLVTSEEILQQLDLTFHPDQLAGRREKGIRYVLDMERKQSLYKICTVTYRSVDPSGETAGGSSQFHIHVMTADQLKMFEDIDRRATIPGLGDDAFYVENAPYARVGDVAVGIAEFPDNSESKAGVELVRRAVPRLPR